MSHVGLAAASSVEGAPVQPISVLISITDEENAMTTPMAPALEALLRQVNLHEDVVGKFRVNELCDREIFVAIDTDESALRDHENGGRVLLWPIST